MKKALGLLLFALAASGCAQLPRPELAAFSEAFQAARTAADPILTDYAIAERGERLSAMRADEARGYDDFFPTFRPADSAALSTLALPPGADAIDRSFRAVARYNDTLVALAENRNVEVARTQLNQALTDLGGVAAPVGQYVPPVQAVAGLLVTALTPAVAMDNREQFRRIVLDAQPQVVALIRVLRDYTPTQYSITTRALVRRARQNPPPPDRAEVVARINEWHRVYADYVALLDAMERRLGDLHNAVDNPRSAPLLGQAATGASELRAYADTLRLSVAALRAQP